MLCPAEPSPRIVMEVEPNGSQQPLQREIIALFEELAQAFGLPKSVGEILGLIYASESPVSFDEVVRELAISKGSASQGLRLLQQVGAVHAVDIDGERKTFYRPELSLRALVGGLLSEKLRPHLDRGAHHVSRIEAVAQGEELSEAMEYRVQLLKNWHRRAEKVLPWVERLVGGQRDQERKNSASKDRGVPLAPHS